MFSRRWIINYLLIVLIVLFTWVGNRFNVETGFQAKPGITELKPQDIDSIEIQTADATLKLARAGGGWMIESPVRWPANNVNVERLLDMADSQTDSRLPADEIDLATVGLQFPRAVLRLNDTQVLFGATNNIGERRYVMVGSTVFLLPDVHLPFVSQGLLGVVDRRLLPRSLAPKAFTLPEFEVTRDANGDWHAANTDIDPAQVSGLVESWQGLGASRIRIYDAGVIPRQKIAATLSNDQRLEYYLMSIDPEIVIANPQIGLQYHFRADYYYQLISLRADEASG